MQLNHWLALGLASFLTVSCTTGGTAPIAESPTPSPSPVAEVSPVPMVAQATEVTEQSGTFVSGEHPTQGTVRLYNRDGQTVVELQQDFETSELGPDLVVVLHRSTDVIGSTEPPAYPINEGDYVVLAPLQAYSGAQSYTISDSVNLADYQSVAIWCRKFNATFGAAVLSPS